MPTEPIARRADDPSAFACRLAGDVVLSCTGELDPTTLPALHRSLQLLLDLGPVRVVVDLGGVTFLDAGAIGELADARAKHRAAGGDLVLRAPSEFGRRVLGIVGQSALIDDAAARPFDLDAFRRELVTAWEAACAGDLYGAAPLVYDPARMIATIVEQLHEPDETPPPALVADAVRSDGPSGALAVMQLWALGDVLRAAASDAPGSEPEGRLRRHLGATIAEMAAMALTELEDRARGPERDAGVGAQGSAGALAGRFTEANRSNVVIDEARGAIAQHFGVSIDEASAMLSTFATTRGQPVAVTAAALMARTLALTDLSPHAPSVRA